MTNYYSFILLLIITSLSACSSILKQASNIPPNVILIITDDQGYGDISAHGNSVINTPNIDLLHDESVRLTDFHVSPTCAPTRAAIMTGRQSNRVGVWHTVMGRSILFESEKTMGEIFAENGYRTALFGKWHLGDNYPFAPHQRGFDEVLTHGGGGIGQTPDYWNNDYFNDTYLHNGKAQKVEGYCTDIWFTEATKFIKKQKEEGKPFFCYISTNAPHSPLNVPTQYVEPYLKKNVKGNRAKFYGMITNIDENIGQLRKQLKEWNIADNTILIYMSDNGTAYGASFKDGHLKDGFNAKMKGTKGSAYEGGHRVPFYIYWKDGNIEKGQLDGLTAHVDLLPTLMGLCNLHDKDNITFDGIDLSKSLQNKENPEHRILIGDSQRLEYPEKWRNSYTMENNWRLINGEELYDIKKDPGQANDIADKYPEVVARLRKAYEENWKDIEKEFQRFPYIKLGSKEEKTSLLTAHDWHIPEGQKIPWNQKMIRKGVDGNGEWRVHFVKSGKYKISLRRWPLESNLGLMDAAPKLVTEAPGYILPKGKAYTFTKAYIKIGEKVWETTISDGSKEVTIEVEVAEGETTMSAYFLTAQNTIQGAFYTYVTPTENTQI